MNPSRLLPWLALLSGSAALVYETIWLRWFRLLFGSTAYAASATLAAFFLGLALGSWWFARVAGRSARPLRVYAAVELGAAATALIVPFVVSLYDPIYAALYNLLASSTAVFTAAKFVLALAAMLPTTVLLGGTLPLLVAGFVSRGEDLGRGGGWLYTTNTLGAALGTAAGALWLPEWLGVRGTYGVGIGLSLLVAVLAFAGGRRVLPGSEAPAADRAPTALLAIAAASGFGTLAFEVLLIHVLGMTLSSSVYSFGAVLIVVLLCLAASAAFVAATADRFDARRMLGAALAIEALILLALPSLLFAASDGLRVTAFESFYNGLLSAALYGAPALLVGGLVFPLTLRLASGGSPGVRAGGLLAANTLGGVLGSLAASYLLLDGIGLWASLAVLAVGYALAALLPGPARARTQRAGLIVTAGAFLWLASGGPLALPAATPPEGSRLLAVHESAHGTLAVSEEASGNRWLRIDQYYGLASSEGSPRQQRWGHLALLQHPDPERVLFVGSATGGTAASAVLHPVESIVLVEIVPAVHALAREFFAPYNRSVHSDPRTRLVIEDGRNHLRAVDERYDVIVADLFVPARPGTGSLYSREHFEAVKAHLTPGGVFVQWLPLYQHSREDFAIVAATFLAAFPEATLWRGDFSAEQAVAGLSSAPGLRSDAALGARLEGLARQGLDDRWLHEPQTLELFYVGPLGLATELLEAPVTSDDRPRFEFVAGRATPEARVAFARQGWPALAERLLARGEATPGMRAGTALQRANLLATSGSPDGRRRALRLQREAVPDALLHPPDRTIGEFWPGQPLR